MRSLLLPLALLLGGSMVTGCGDDGDPGATKTVTVSPAPTSASTSPTDAATAPPSSTPVPEPDGHDFRAVAIYTVQTETRGFSDWDDAGVVELLQGVCDTLYVTDGRNIDDFGFETAELWVESAGGAKADVPIVMRASVAVCPRALEEIAERYGT